MQPCSIGPTLRLESPVVGELYSVKAAVQPQGAQTALGEVDVYNFTVSNFLVPECREGQGAIRFGKISRITETCRL